MLPDAITIILLLGFGLGAIIRPLIKILRIKRI
jgi:hypothetical protein